MAQILVGFQIGTGGRFNNPGHNTFLEECKENQDFTFFEKLGFDLEE